MAAAGGREGARLEHLIEQLLRHGLLRVQAHAATRLDEVDEVVCHDVMPFLPPAPPIQKNRPSAEGRRAAKR